MHTLINIYTFLYSPGCGTSWHAAGLIGTLRKTKETAQNSLYAQKLFEEFENDSGVGNHIYFCFRTSI